MDGTNGKGIVNHKGEFHMKAMYQIVFAPARKPYRRDMASVHTRKRWSAQRDFCNEAKMCCVDFESEKSNTRLY